MKKEIKKTKKKAVKKVPVKRAAKTGQFAPGNQSGNRRGRPPKVKCIKNILEKIGDEYIQYKNQKMTKIEAILRTTYAKALAGESWALTYISERTEGKVTDKLKVDGTQKVEFVDLSKGNDIKLEDILVD